MRHPPTNGASRRHNRGAALLIAMLTVALVATLASAALWRQWRNVEVEASERSRMQAGWILGGALDWARLILREDARAGGPDHLGEPWSVPLQESRLSAFVAIDKDRTDDADQVFLSGQITDAQARMNVRNLVADGKISEPDQQAFSRLFEKLGLEPSEVDTVAANLVLALNPASDAANDTPVPLLPRRVDQLRWLGLSEYSLVAVSPHITMLPVRTSLNLNTAGPEAIAASMPELDLTDARRLVSARERAAFRTLVDVAKVLPANATAPAATQFSVATRYFEVRGRLRIEQLVVDERSLLFRNGMEVSTLWRERLTADPVAVPAATR
jgi:general secretion pathway protein K